jgi:hypothetical protein
MRGLLRFGVLGALLLASTSGCYVRTERVVAMPTTPTTCAQTVWVEGHYEPHGRWVPAHWRCVRGAY